MARGPSPQLGFNTNIRHKGRLFHVQTEDSGVAHPHITTHLFADGGRIVASRKTDYATHVGAENLQDIVKKLMQEQHKGMCIALRDGAYDDGAKAAPVAAPAGSPHARKASSAPPAPRVSRPPPAKRASLPPPPARASRPAPAKRASLAPPPARASRRPPAPAARPPIDLDAFDRAAEARIAESAIARAPKRRRKGRDSAQRTPARPVRGKTLDDVIRAYLDDEGRKREK